MFYSTQILAKKGPLGTIWIAAHSMDRKLKRHQIFETSIPVSVDSIMNPEAPLALRLSGQLLLGVVRIYSRKVGYLFQDCNDALVKITQAFKPANVDLPEGGTMAASQDITLPDDGNDMEFYTQTQFTFEPFEFTQGTIQFTVPAHRESFMLADDPSLYASHMSQEDEYEQFEVAGDDVDRRLSEFDLEVEHARAAPASAGMAGPATPLDFNDTQATGMEDAPHDAGGAFGDDELLMVPPDAMLNLDLTMTAPGPTPGGPQQDRSAGAAPQPSASRGPQHSGGLSAGPTPMDALDALPDLGDMTQEADSARDTEAPDLGAADLVARPASTVVRRVQQRGAAARKKRPRLDVGEDGRPATELARAAISALLMDRAPLLTLRGRGGAAALQLSRPHEFHVTVLSGGASEDPLRRPAFAEAMAPALYSLYQRCLEPPGAAATAAAAAEPEQEGPNSHSARRGELEMDASEHAAEDAGAAAQDGLPDVGGADPEAEPFMDDFGAGVHEDRSMPGDFDMDMDAGHLAPDGTQSPRGAPSLEAAASGDHNNDAAPGSLDRSIGSLPGGAGPTPDLDAVGEADEGEDEEGSEGEDGEDVHRSSFTARTKLVLAHLQAKLLDPQTGKKRKRSMGGSQRPPLSLDSITAGRSRLEASRWFFESLVLRGQGYVELEQTAPYADIMVKPLPKLASYS